MDTLDPAVTRCLPENATPTRIIPWGSSGWTQTRRITVELLDGTEREYFIKDCNTEVAEVMFRGEFYSLKTLHGLLPESCPEPFGWGQYDRSPDTYFLIMEFLYMVSEHPDAEKITDLLATLHRTTAGTSPDNKFGFHVPTCHGKLAQPNGWDANWCRFYSNLLTVYYEADMEVNGPFPEYEEAFATLQEKVVPRLLEPLQSDGRELLPCLIHGDLWQGNTGINEETDEPMLVDPSLFYAHNELEMGMWRTPFVSFSDNYRRQYTLRFPPSEPSEEWEDRNRLYSIVFQLGHASHWLGAANETRLRTLEDMHYLINAYT